MIRDTSKLSYFESRKEGLGQRQLSVYAAITYFPKSTDRELAKYLGVSDPNYVRPRRFELLKRGLIKEAGKKVCSVTKKLSYTWEVVF